MSLTLPIEHPLHEVQRRLLEKYRTHYRVVLEVSKALALEPYRVASIFSDRASPTLVELVQIGRLVDVEFTIEVSLKPRPKRFALLKGRQT